MVDPEHDDSADNSDNDAVDVESGNPNTAEQIEQEATNERADDAENNIKHHALPCPGVNPARDKTGNQAKH